MPDLNLSSYTQTFGDDFNVLSVSQNGVGTTWKDIRPYWRYDANSDIGFGNSSFVDSASGYQPFSVNNGTLAITATPDRTPYGYPGSWESGILTSEGTFSQTYGYFVVRANFSHQPGAWDAFWLMPNTQIADPNGAGFWQELDVVEHYGDYPQGVYSNIHTTDAAPNSNWQANLQVYSELQDPNGFHTYGVDWEKDAISFFVDGRLVGSHPTPTDMNGPMYLMLNLATQNAGTNNANIAGVPITSYIDYIRAYAANPYTGPSTTTIGAGPDSISLHVSEDAYAGDAQFTVFIDGVQVGGLQTAHAAHSDGQSDLITIDGSWGPGSHTVTIDFLNDLYAGTPSTDRNLYLDSAEYDGSTLLGAQLSALSSGPVSMTFNIPATQPPANVGTNPSATTPQSTGQGSSTSPGWTVVGDTVTFGHTRDAYTITSNGNGYTVSGPDGTEPISNIDTLIFSDKKIDIDHSFDAALVFSVYQAALGRYADSAGEGYWLDWLHSGNTPTLLAQQFMDSTEFQSRFGVNTTDSQYVSALYQNVLHRSPDAAGLTYWMGLLSNEGRDQFLVAFAASPENQANVQGLIGQGVLVEHALG